MRRALLTASVLLVALAPTAAAASAQAESDRIAGWMAAELRADVPARAVASSVHHQLDAVCAGNVRWAAYVCNVDPTTIRIRPWLVGALERRSCIALRYMLHEHLHAVRGFGDLGLEEGVVDALAHDLYPAAARSLDCRGRVGPIVFYLDAAEAVWTSSVVATGSRTRLDRAAREWVRRMWAADTATRHLMLAAIPARANPSPTSGERNP